VDLSINTAADATNALVASPTQNTAVDLPTLFVGDVVALKITFSDGAGGLAYFTGSAGVAILVAIGVLQTRQAYTTTGTLSEDGQGYLATLDLGTQELKDAIGGLETLDLHLEVQASFANGTTETLLQKTAEMRQQLVE
tara:strand:- start:1082 stop:1498 length:417 start_codon:yes stop_codon:yes gene_type:complete